MLKKYPIVPKEFPRYKESLYNKQIYDNQYRNIINSNQTNEQEDVVENFTYIKSKKNQIILILLIIVLFIYLNKQNIRITGLDLISHSDTISYISRMI
tara:strand:+ start:1315 stop:1608 length:294 start_codon:yes stop_codon:yes gene_type:complete